MMSYSVLQLLAIPCSALAQCVTGNAFSGVLPTWRESPWAAVEIFDGKIL